MVVLLLGVSFYLLCCKLKDSRKEKKFVSHKATQTCKIHTKSVGISTNLLEALEVHEVVPLHQSSSDSSSTRRKPRDDITFTSGWRKVVKLVDLIRANLIKESRVSELENSKISKKELEEELKPFLVGQYPVAGLYDEESSRKMSVFEAYRVGIISKGTAVSLLEAQAAVGSITDPISGEHLSLDEAVSRDLLDREFATLLSRAERAVTGFKPKGSDQTLSLFQAMKKGLVVESHAIRLLEAQIATGGVIDPIANHRVPVEVAFERGLFDEKLNRILQSTSDDTKGFFDPNTNENLTYLQLMERCIKDPNTNLLLIPLTTQLHNKRILERRKSRDDITFTSGWGKTVKLSDLLRAKIIEESKVEGLEASEITEEEVARHLQPFLIGKYPIAGIYDDRIGKTMTLFNAYKERLITRGTALSLLEAQAAVGSIANPITGQHMPVDDALEQGLLDKQFAAVLKRAERAVTGFKPKGSDETLSLFQAMKRGLVVENHGIRLLEAQIATGGIIDPIANHRLPVEIAFERGLFDERLHRILDDPDDDTKGFLDPNTRENLTYLELMERCVEDPATKLLLVPIVKQEDKILYKSKSPSVSSSIQSRLSPTMETSGSSSRTSLSD